MRCDDRGPVACSPARSRADGGMSFLRRRSHARPPGERTARQRAGDAAESAACARLEAAGCRILGRNLRYRAGEIDIVADDGGTLVFVEVRMRRNDAFGGAGGSVDRFKQQRLLRAARLYLQQRFGSAATVPPCRFDVITADGDGLRDWIRDAFAAD